MTTTRTHTSHGAFRLWHTFSSENLYTAQQGTTRNLMDYNGTNSELYKYQWDYIHNPQEGIVKWMVDDEESEAYGDNTHSKCISTEIAQQIKKKYRYFYLPDGSVADYNDYLPSGFYTADDGTAATSYGAVAAIREGGYDYYFIYKKESKKNVGYGFLLDEKAHAQYTITPIANPNLEQLNPVRVMIEGNNVKTIDYLGNETVYNNAICDCNMAKFRELTPDMLISEPDDAPTAPRWFYDKNTNEIIIVTDLRDLKWIRVTDNGKQYDLDSLVAQGATYCYFGDSKYNWLRTDVINTMNEAGKYVTIGLAATIAAPYLIEYAMVYGEQAFIRLVQKMGADAAKKFAIGTFVGGASYVVGQKIFKQEIKTADIIYHSVMGGVSNLFENKFAKTAISCADGMDFSDVYTCMINLVDSDNLDEKCPYVKMVIECGTSVILGELMSTAKFKEFITNLDTKAKLILASRRGALGSPIAELRIYEKLASIKQSDWATKRIAIIEKYGDKGFRILRDANFDYSKMNADNFEILSEFAQSASETNLAKMKELLQSKSASWAIHKLRVLKQCPNIDEFARAIDQIYNKAKDLSVAVNGAKVPFQSVLDNVDDYAVRYYYKQDGNYFSFVMQIGEIQDYIVNIDIEFSKNISKIVVTKMITLKTGIVDYINELIYDE